MRQQGRLMSVRRMYSGCRAGNESTVTRSPPRPPEVKGRRGNCECQARLHASPILVRVVTGASAPVTRDHTLGSLAGTVSDLLAKGNRSEYNAKSIRRNRYGYPNSRLLIKYMLSSGPAANPILNAGRALPGPTCTAMATPSNSLQVVLCVGRFLAVLRKSACVSSSTLHAALLTTVSASSPLLSCSAPCARAGADGARRHCASQHMPQCLAADATIMGGSGRVAESPASGAAAPQWNARYTVRKSLRSRRSFTG